jgi:hypothetical protein
VELNPSEASVQKLAQAVADTPGLHGKPYEAALILRVENLAAPETKKKIDEALKGVKGVDSAMVIDEKANQIGIKFTKLEAAQGTGTGLESILKALEAAGLKAATA